MTVTADQLVPLQRDVAALVYGRGFTDEQIDRHARAAAFYAHQQLAPFMASLSSPPLVALTWVACSAAARLERHEQQDEERAQAHIEAALRVQRDLGRELDRVARLVANEQGWRRT